MMEGVLNMNKNGNRNFKDAFIVTRMLILAVGAVSGGLVLQSVGPGFTDNFKHPLVQFLVGVSLAGGMLGYRKSQALNIVVISALFVLLVQHLSKRFPEDDEYNNTV